MSSDLRGSRVRPLPSSSSMVMKAHPILPLLPMMLQACSPATQCTTNKTQSIIDGTAASTDEYSATGALLVHAEFESERLGEIACSAVLIAPDVGLTAGHCVALYQQELETGLPPPEWYLSFSNDLTRFENEDAALPTDAIRVREIRLHPEFSLENRAPREALGQMNDLALLILESSATDVAPVRLHTGEITLEEKLEVQIAGYGNTHLDDDEDTLGIKHYGNSYLFAVGEYELRVGRSLNGNEKIPEGVADKCYGDSGGPTFLEVGGEVRLLGITSRGYGAGSGCEAAGIDTRVGAYVDWIDEELASSCRQAKRSSASCAQSTKQTMNQGTCQ